MSKLVFPPSQSRRGIKHTREFLVREVVGYGNNTTGGLGGTVREVTNLNDSGAGSLREAAETPGTAWIVFRVSGTISLSSEIHVTSNKTIDGRGADITISGRSMSVGTWTPVVTGPVTNVIIENIKFKGLLQGLPTNNSTLLSIAENASDVWVDHCTFQDSWDDELYIGSGSVLMSPHIAPLRITISWCHFPIATDLVLYENKSFLITDENNTVDAATQITYHHNYFQTEIRHPLARWVTLHGFNNYFRRTEVTVQVFHHTKYLSENDIFELRPGNIYPMVKVDESTTLPADNAKVVNPWLLNGAQVEEINTAGIFVPSYPYTLETANQALLDRIVAGAGWQAS